MKNEVVKLGVKILSSSVKRRANSIKTITNTFLAKMTSNEGESGTPPECNPI
jgi:hypothetical protein